MRDAFTRWRPKKSELRTNVRTPPLAPAEKSFNLTAAVQFLFCESSNLQTDFPPSRKRQAAKPQTAGDSQASSFLRELQSSNRFSTKPQTTSHQTTNSKRPTGKPTDFSGQGSQDASRKRQATMLAKSEMVGRQLSKRECQHRTSDRTTKTADFPTSS